MVPSCPDSANRSRFLILGTAGHIDHGKTSLVKALTGTSTDRLPEERRRGLTIELGFAELAIDDIHFGIVDVPGHERFVRTMVAGATGIDMALIVIAGDDSVMPQTVEHTEVLRLVQEGSEVHREIRDEVHAGELSSYQGRREMYETRDAVSADIIALIGEESYEALDQELFQVRHDMWRSRR